ncbi:MAG: hypothetical protein Q7J73_04980 [Dehalococcoidales bacterium]|nr:hypothetical protein [Dehalococcoidales bacterium]
MVHCSWAIGNGVSVPDGSGFIGVVEGGVTGVGGGGAGGTGGGTGGGAGGVTCAGSGVGFCGGGLTDTGGAVGVIGGTVSGIVGVTGAGETGGTVTGAAAFGGPQLASKRATLIIKGTNLHFTKDLCVNVPQCIVTVKLQNYNILVSCLTLACIAAFNSIFMGVYFNKGM